MVQVATWNDYGEGTMIEPTWERGYASLLAVQNLTGSAATISNYELISNVYNGRMWNASVCAAQSAATAHLDAASTAIVLADFVTAASELQLAEQACSTRTLTLTTYPHPLPSPLTSHLSPLTSHL